jgi:hypothetical protein
MINLISNIKYVKFIDFIELEVESYEKKINHCVYIVVLYYQDTYLYLA